MKRVTIRHDGFSLIEVIFVSAILALFFGGLFASIQYSLDLIGTSRGKLSALSVASDRMEYIRSLPYDSVGTVAGFPSGAIPQISTTTLNGFILVTRTLIEYIDDDGDGAGGSDSNSITTDYKRVKVDVSWNIEGETKKVSLTSNIIPRSIETNVGGGTIRVNVFDADVVPLQGAQVRVFNTSLGFPYDVTKTSDSFGAALFSVASGSEYEIVVTRAGYSQDQTYRATSSVPNPLTPPASVLPNGVSTLNFFIDELSDLNIVAYSTKTFDRVGEEFASSTAFATSTLVEVIDDEVRLAESSPGTYELSGSAFLLPITPSPLAAWSRLFTQSTTTSNTFLRTRLYTGSGPYTLIPDSDLPGNSLGFTTSPIDLSTLDVSSYPSLVVGIELTTSDVSETPSLGSTTVEYIDTLTPAASLPLTVRGTKSIGTDALTVPVYKYTSSSVTSVSGELTLANLEWDSYTFTAPGFDIAEACRANPFVLNPGVTGDLEIIIAPDSPHSLRVSAQASGVPIEGAGITLSSPTLGSIGTKQTSRCGQSYFGGLTSATDYVISVVAPPYTTQTISDYSVNGDGVVVVSF